MNGSGRQGADWRAGVRVTEEPVLVEELDRRWERASGLRAVGVTDLLALRRAYWRAVVPPVEIPLERQARMASGRLLHRQLGATLARDGSLEVRVRRDGLVGRIDVFTDRPVEVKTAAEAVEPSALLAQRPEYVAQLAMYCGLVDRPLGRIVELEIGDRRVKKVRTAEVTVDSPSAVLREMRENAELLRACWKQHRPEGLPRCAWFDRGCEYQTSGACDCNGNEPERPAISPGAIARVTPNPDLDARLFEELNASLGASDLPTIARFRDMIYPRRAYFEKTRPIPPAEARGARAEEEPDTYARLTESIESGPVGEVTRLPSLASDPEEEVTAFRNDPYLARTSRARTPLAADELVGQSPQYALDLGYRCAATGRSSGRVFVAYERAGRASDRLRVFRVDFASVTVFARMWRERVAELGRALLASAPESLAACPEWMYADCPYRSECGCGSPGGRTQR